MSKYSLLLSTLIAFPLFIFFISTVSAAQSNEWQNNGTKIYYNNGSSGKVGIRISNPVKELDLKGDIQLRNGDKEIGKGSEIGFTSYYAKTGPKIKSVLNDVSNDPSASLVLSSRSAGVDNEEVTLKDGKVGIGTSGPQASLHIFRNEPASTTENQVLIEKPNSGTQKFIMKSANDKNQNQVIELKFNSGSDNRKFELSSKWDSNHIHSFNQPLEINATGGDNFVTMKAEGGGAQNQVLKLQHKANWDVKLRSRWNGNSLIGTSNVPLFIGNTNYEKRFVVKTDGSVCLGNC